MPSSGTYNFSLANSSVILEAFDRIKRPPQTIARHEMLSARTSLNLEMVDWEDAGFNFWKTTSGTINLAVNTPTYTLPANLVTLEEIYYSAINQGGAGVNQDRIMVPITRTQYAQIVNKLQQGIPTQYWYQMQPIQQVTIWEVPQAGQVAPQFVLSWFGLQQMQDMNIGGGETPDVPRRALDALCAKMALRLCEKFGPSDPQAHQIMMQEKAAKAEDAWAKLQRRDGEPGPITFRPNVQVYARMGSR